MTKNKTITPTIIDAFTASLIVACLGLAVTKEVSVGEILEIVVAFILNKVEEKR